MLRVDGVRTVVEWCHREKLVPGLGEEGKTCWQEEREEDGEDNGRNHHLVTR